VTGAAARPLEGLRERKKRLMRRQLSDTATRMFLDRGFEVVRIADVAEACGVSEKTVFNYFPTKEALLLDRLEATAEALAVELSRPDRAPLDAALAILGAELEATIGGFAGPDAAAAMAAHRRFGDMLAQTPALHAHRSAMLDRFVHIAADALARRVDGAPGDPEQLITAAALVGLWRVQFGSLRRHLDQESDPAALAAAVTADVARAARLLRQGLGG
jgi:AcrR family transcriptional regulator